MPCVINTNTVRKITRTFWEYIRVSNFNYIMLPVLCWSSESCSCTRKTTAMWLTVQTHLIVGDREREDTAKYKNIRCTTVKTFFSIKFYLRISCVLFPSIFAIVSSKVVKLSHSVICHFNLGKNQRNCEEIASSWLIQKRVNHYNIMPCVANSFIWFCKFSKW
jgi:hypothetical protein